MLAVKYREDVPFKYPVRTLSNVESLPQGFDELLSQGEYDQLLLDNSQAWADHKAKIAQENVENEGASRFRKIREKWQDMSDRFANSNVSSGITTVEAKAIADSFTQVKYYLETNVPMEAISQIDSIPTDVNYFTVAVRDEMKAELLAFVTATFGIE